MKKFAILAMLAAGLALAGCGSNKGTSSTTSTSTSGDWEAQLTGGTGQASLLNFVVSFNVTNSGPLNITGFSFFNGGACFANGANAETENGTATITTDSTDKVTGNVTLTVSSVTPSGNTLTLTGDLTGTSSGTASTTGTLSNGVVVGTWNLTGGQGDPSCAGSGSFIMCQNKNTCTAG